LGIAVAAASATAVGLKGKKHLKMPLACHLVAWVKFTHTSNVHTTGPTKRRVKALNVICGRKQKSGRGESEMEHTKEEGKHTAPQPLPHHQG